jgi:hypothetical protein
MKKQNSDNQNSNKTKSSFNIKSATDFYRSNKNVINGVGIAAATGLAAYAIVKWLPYQEIATKIEEKFEEQFGNKSLPTERRQA